MVSEDPQGLGGLSMIHRLSDPGDLHDPRDRQMSPKGHQIDDRRELLEVFSLRGSEWVFPEERDDHVPQIPEPSNDIPVHVLPVVVVSGIRVDLPATEEAGQVFEDPTARLPLRDSEFRSNLPSHGHLAVPVDGAAKAAFPIHEPHDPAYSRESFLLVFRT